MPIRLYQEGMVLGVGYDTLSSQVRGFSVARPDATAPAGGQQTTFHLDYVTSHEQLTELLDVSFSGSFGNAVSPVSVSASASFVNSHSVDTYSVYLLAKVEVVNLEQRMPDVQLKPEAFNLMRDQGPDAFRKEYGDEYVIGITTGGHYTALLQLVTQRDDDKTEIKASVKAAGGLGSWQANANFKDAMTNLSEQYETHVSVLQEGGVQQITSTTIPDMIRDATNFPTTVTQALAVPFRVETIDYNSVTLPPQRSPIDVQNLESGISFDNRH